MREGYLVKRLKVVDPDGTHWGAAWLCRARILRDLRRLPPGARLARLHKLVEHVEYWLRDGGKVRIAQTMSKTGMILLEEEGRVLDRRRWRTDEVEEGTDGQE